ncbi:MAG: outer membrane protein assembly factor [Cytophagaceae bacterium]|nr:outer membrane protein assembly factor [Cytophagaceae bacterium]
MQGSLAFARYSIFIIGLALIQSNALAQKSGPIQWAKRMVVNFVNDTLPPDKPRFLVYPTLVYAPETSFEFGLSSLFLYHAKNNVAENRLSEIVALGFFTLKQQYGFSIDNNLYSDQDRWFFLGRSRFQHFPLLYYGIGPNTPNDEPATIDATYLQIRQRALRKTIPNLFIGPEVDFQRLSRVNFRQPEGNHLAVPLGGTGTTNLGLGAGLVFDNRHNPLNVREGFFSEIALLRYHPRWGSQYNFSSIVVDTRLYRPVGKQVVALQAYGNFTAGEVPFNQLALLGGDMLMRGYYAGRYRDRNYLGAQAEYRFLPFPFSKRIGGAAFVAAGTVAPRLGAFNFGDVKPSGGVGLRYLLFPKKDIFLRFDLGVTREGTGFYIYTGEAF